MVGYHLTTMRNWKKIQNNGLVPQIGPRSRFVGEPRKAIYLFRNVSNLWWMRDGFKNEPKPMILLEVQIPSIAEIEIRNIELICYSRIPVESISFLREVYNLR